MVVVAWQELQYVFFFFALSLFLLAYGGGRFKIFNYRKGPLNYIRARLSIPFRSAGMVGTSRTNSKNETKRNNFHLI